jgi:dolichol-phosphate mannosyltransferase
MTEPTIDFSVVVPVYEEEENVQELHRRLTRTMEALARPYEVIFINDGSEDGTLEQLRAIQGDDPNVRILNLARNFGHQAAVTAGLDHAVGEAVIVMDGDLQDPPEVIPDLVARWREGYDVAYAVRTKRKESRLKRAAYATFYRLLRNMSDTDLPLDSGDFSLMDRKVVVALRRMPEHNRFVRGLRSWVGFNQIGVEYERDRRHEGRSKYGLRALMELATNGFVSFSKLPLRVATYFGMAVSMMAFLFGLLFVVLRLVTQIRPQGWTSIIVVVLFLGGVQLITVGIVGEYVGHILDEVRQRPSYILRESDGARDTSPTVRFSQVANTGIDRDRQEGYAESRARPIAHAAEGDRARQ